MSFEAEVERIKKAALSAIDDEKEEILGLSRFINRNPEISYRESLASKKLVSFFKSRGFETVMPYGGIETGFSAGYNCSIGQSAIAFLAEYDALVSVGHGCGHNLIAAAAAAAAIGTAAACRAAKTGGGFDIIPGFRVIGTPAEEVVDCISGKTKMLENGAFSDTSGALMFHPWTSTGVARKDLGYSTFRITFQGRPAHAAADPWNGRNALDAAVVFYNSISMLRQQLPSGMRMHCILPEAGTVLNILPECCTAEVMIRSTELDYLKNVERNISGCAGGAAAAAGCNYEMELLSSVKPVFFNQDFFEKLKYNMQRQGEKLEEMPLWEASSDFGDVSREIPSLSLLYQTHDADICWHSREAAREADSEKANEAMLRAAGYLALTAIDLIFTECLLK
jgi:amidohydrolase